MRNIEGVLSDMKGKVDIDIHSYNNIFFELQQAHREARNAEDKLKAYEGKDGSDAFITSNRAFSVEYGRNYKIMTESEALRIALKEIDELMDKVKAQKNKSEQAEERANINYETIDTLRSVIKSKDADIKVMDWKLNRVPKWIRNIFI